MDLGIEQARALVIDGNLTSRSVLSAQLRDLGVGHVRQTGRVNDARLLLEHKPYDIVMCDYHFDGSDMSGQDLLDELRRENLLPHSTVFIMVTGDATYAKVVEAAESVLDGFLVKPYTPATLGERVIEARRRKRALKDIFLAMENHDQDRAMRMCVQRYVRRELYWQFCARMATELMLKLDRSGEARSIYESMAKESNQLWARVGVARSMFAAGEVFQARRELDALILENPQHADAYDVLGSLQVDQGEFGQALDTFRRASALTPGCLLRLQHCGTLAFYQGQTDEALSHLERTRTMGARSKLFDPLTLVLLALLRFDSGDAKGLQAVHEQLRRYVERLGETPRLKAYERTTAALRAMAARDLHTGTTMAREMAAELEVENFDVEVANVLLCLLSRVPESHIPPQEAAAVARRIGTRFCVSKAVTEMLVAASGKSEGMIATIRACHTEIAEIAQEAMNFSVRGEPRMAVISLLDRGAHTRNAKLIEMARLVTRRHIDVIEDSATLLARATDLQHRLCHPITHLAGVRRTGRSPGGLVLRS